MDTHILSIDWAKNHLGFSLYDLKNKKVVLTGMTNKKYKQFCKEYVLDTQDYVSDEYDFSNLYQELQAEYIEESLYDYFENKKKIEFKNIPIVCVIENLYLARMTMVNLEVAKAYGVFIHCLYKHIHQIIKLKFYAPIEIKKCFTQNHKAEKNDIRNNIVVKGEALINNDIIPVYEAQPHEKVTHQNYTTSEFTDMYIVLTGKKFDKETDIGDSLALLYTYLNNQITV